MAQRIQAKEKSSSLITRFIRLAKLRIIFLVIFTAIIGALISSNNQATFLQIIQISIVVFFSGSGAKLMNNILDYKIDSLMERTKDRKEDIDAIGKFNLWTIAIIFCIASIILSFIWFHIVVSILIIAAIVSYVVWYTLYLKRYSSFGVIIGGLPGALPVLIGGFAITRENLIELWLLFCIMMLWQPPHFWALALKMQKDYKNANIPVFSMSYGQNITNLFIYLYISALIPLGIFIGYYGKYSILYFIFSTLSSLYYLVASWYLIEKKQDYEKAFFASIIYLFMFLLSILLRYL